MSNERYVVTLTCRDEVRTRRVPSGDDDTFRCAHCKASIGWKSYHPENGGREVTNKRKR